MLLKIGTRGSMLALVQAYRVCTMLKAKGIDTEIKVITTEGAVSYTHLTLPTKRIV